MTEQTKTELNRKQQNNIHDRTEQCVTGYKDHIFHAPFWFNSYFHATATTQSGSCSKRTHLCHHTASRVDTALDSALNMRTEYFQRSVFAQTRAAKQAGFYVYEHWTRSDMCLSNVSETRAVKTRQDACQLWRVTSPAAEDCTASAASCNKQCVCQQKRHAGVDRAGVAAGRIAATYGFPSK